MKKLIIVVMLIAMLVVAFAPLRLVRIHIKNNSSYQVNVKMEDIDGDWFYFLRTDPNDETVWTVIKSEYLFKWYLIGDDNTFVCMKPAVGLEFDKISEQWYLWPLTSTVLVFNDCYQPDTYAEKWWSKYVPPFDWQDLFVY